VLDLIYGMDQVCGLAWGTNNSLQRCPRLEVSAQEVLADPESLLWKISTKEFSCHHLSSARHNVRNGDTTVNKIDEVPFLREVMSSHYFSL
jgi:hypothetical protein